MRILSAVNRCAAEGIVGVMLVEPVILVEHGNTRCLQRRYIPEHVPHHLKVVVHLPSASHKEALCHILASVTAAAGQLQFLQKVNMLPLHLPVTHQIECRGQSGKSRTDNVCRFLVYAFRFLGMCKRFISSC